MRARVGEVTDRFLAHAGPEMGGDARRLRQPLALRPPRHAQARLRPVVAPYLVVGATDARRFRDLAPDVYRFTPAVMPSADLARVHGTNERIPTRVYHDAVRFNAQLLRNAAR